MEIKEFENKMNEYGKEIGIVFHVKQIEKFYTYMNLLKEWNEKINLTAITDEEEIILKHFIDSLTISKYIPQNAYLLDIGTGAGFPGIPIKIFREDVNVVLVDSLNKRINFLENVSHETKLENIEILHYRVEEFGKIEKYREKFDIVTARAVANMSVLSEYLIPLTKLKGKCICMKGSEIEQELEKSKKAIEILGGKIEKVDCFELAKSDIRRNIVIIDKIKTTPSKYPRKPGMPSKEPLK